MKISPATLESLRAAIAPILTDEIRAKYQAAGKSPMRFRWDALWASKFDTRILYAEGLNDAHIDTALRHIVDGAK